MQKAIKYVVFKTKWGYFGIAATYNGLLRTCLPGGKSEIVKLQLIKGLQSARYDRDLFKQVQEQITAYFEGDCISFEGIPVVLDGFGLFARRVFAACRKIKFGQTVSYGRLAEMAGRTCAARAVGGAMAKNPLPLIIPCHRVIRADGEVGGFSAIGGRSLKGRLLKHEYQALISNRDG